MTCDPTLRWLRLEQLGMDVYPAFTEERRLGCVFRAAGGFNFRNSSVTVHDPARGAERLIDETINFCTAHGIAPVLRVPVLWPDFEAALGAAGWVQFRECEVLDRALNLPGGGSAALPSELDHVNHDDWLAFQLGQRDLTPRDAEILTGVFAALPDDADRSFWREGDEVLGSALVSYDGPDAALMNMIVSSRARGRGVGRRFLAAILARAALRGASRMWLQVFVENPAALALYRSAGFELVYRYAYWRPGPSGG